METIIISCTLIIATALIVLGISKIAENYTMWKLTKTLDKIKEIDISEGKLAQLLKGAYLLGRYGTSNPADIPGPTDKCFDDLEEYIKLSLDHVKNKKDAKEGTVI